MARRAVPLGCVLAALASVAALLPAGASASGTRRSVATLSVDLGVLQQLNQIRAAHHLVTLTLSRNLDAAAMQHSQDMLTNGYFAHSSSDGEPFWKRIEVFYSQPRSGYWSVGENLYWTAGPATAAGSMKAWMASPGHRANILSPQWRDVGIAALAESDAPGTFGGATVTLITTDFGVRR